MKTKILFIAAIQSIFCFYSVCCTGQKGYGISADELAYHKRIIKNPNVFIFEGSVMRHNTYHGKGQQAWDYYVVKIIKIYNGNPQLKLGTIKVIKQIGDYIKNSEGIIPLSDGGEGLQDGCTYIVFGNPTTFEPADTNIVHLIITDNILTLVPFSQIDLLCKNYFDINTGKYVPPYQFDSVNKIHKVFLPDNGIDAWWENTKYKSIDSLYSFFKANGLTVQEEQK